MAAAFDGEQFAKMRSGTDYLFPIDVSGKLRLLKFDWVAVGAGVTPTTISLTKLPPGRVRVLPWMSRLWHTAFGSSLVCDIGHAAYNTESNAAVAADVDAFTTTIIDIENAGNNIVLDATLHQFDLFSMKGIDVIATVTGGDTAAADALHGYIAYLHE